MNDRRQPYEVAVRTPSFNGARAHPQVVLITGATSAIGRSLAHDLFRSDCRLILCARNDHDLEQLKSELISAARNGILLF